MRAYLNLLIVISCNIIATLSANLDSTANVYENPVVMWHGMGDSCCNPFSLGSLIPIIQEHVSGVYVKSLRIGNNIIEDTENGFFLNVNKQIEDVCQQISSDPLLKNGYNAIGFSQGGQFLRAVAQRCPDPPMLKLITLGGQHQGVYGLPKCGPIENKLCNYIRKILNVGAYWSWVQNDLVQAEYWHDPLNEEKYRAASVFLSDINNEINVNQTYIDNLSRLKKFVMVKFNNDSMVEPIESSWFGFYEPGQASKILNLQQTKLYIEDRLGLQQMEKSGKLDFIKIDGDHLQFSLKWFVEEIILKYLKS